MLSANTKKYLLIIIGSLVWSLAMVKSGLVYSYGMGFWGPNGHDGIWHVSLINSLAKGSLSMPIFAGEIIKNYHLGFDLLLAGIHVITRIPVINLYFQIIPPVLALALGWLVYHLTFLWKKSHSLALWAVFFTYFGGSLGWVFGQGESLFWAQQASSSLVNPPYTLSLIILLAGLIFLHNNHYFWAIVMFAVLPQIKIYAGILAFAGLFVSVLNSRKLFKVFIPALLLALVMYLPLNSFSSRLVVFKPFWFLDTLFSPDRLNWPQFFSALSTYKMGQIWSKAIPAYAVALFIFLVGNLSLRIIGLLPLLKIRCFSWFEWFITVVTLGGIVIPMLFIQSGTSWNTIQFFYYSQFFLSLFTAWVIDRVLSTKSKATALIISLCIIAFTLPTARETLNHYLPNRPPAKISQEELDALRFLSRQPQGVVLTQLFSKDAADTAQTNPPRPLYLYESTAYVSAISGQQVFLEDEVNLSITSYSWEARRQEVKLFFNTNDYGLARKFLENNQIDYIYLIDIPLMKPPINLSQVGYKTIYQQTPYQIWKKDPPFD